VTIATKIYGNAYGRSERSGSQIILFALRLSISPRVYAFTQRVQSASALGNGIAYQRGFTISLVFNPAQ